MRFLTWQKKTLALLLDQYENSKTYLGENLVAQRFSVRPEKIWDDYTSDYADLDLVRDFERQMGELEAEGFVVIKRGHGAIEKIVANPTDWRRYYECLQRSDRKSIQNKQIALYESYLGKGHALDLFCEEQIGRLRANKKAAYDVEDAENILKLCAYLLQNREDILEREFSMAVLGDSKRWEKKYRSKVVKILKSYGDYGGLLFGFSDAKDAKDAREAERILLAEHHVHSNPAYVYVKGDAAVAFDHGKNMELNRHMPMAFSSEAISHIKEILIESKRVMTVENLTSFHRIEPGDTFLIYLGGYHNVAVQALAQKMRQANPKMAWRHFGDIDPDGFAILEHLRRSTGIDVLPVYMDRAILEKYQIYAKKLNGHDVRKAKAFLCNGLYCDMMQYMLEIGCKLEQEIVSWMECLPSLFGAL